MITSPWPTLVTALLETRDASAIPQTYRGYTAFVTGQTLTVDDIHSFTWWAQPLFHERVKGSLNETIGSLLEQTTVKASEISLNENFYIQESTDLTAAELVDFQDAFGQLMQTRYPLPVNNREYLATYRARTNLGRLSDTIPQAIVAKTSDLGLGETATLQQLLEHLASEWEQEFPWLTFEPIPDLRYRTLDDDYSGGAGTLRVGAIILPQTGDNRKSIAAILDELLSLVPGTMRQTSRGTIEIVAFAGPDAPSTPEVTLTPHDLYGVSAGKPDPSQLYNRARVMSTGVLEQSSQPLFPPLYGFATTQNESNFHTVLPTNRERANVGETRPFAEDMLVSGNTMKISWAATGYRWAGHAGLDNLEIEGASSGTITLTRGGPAVTQNLKLWYYYSGPFSFDFYATLSWRWTNDGLRFDIPSISPAAGWQSANFGNIWWPGVVVNFDVTGTAYTQRRERIESHYSVETMGGANAPEWLRNSERDYGPRELTVETEVFPLTPAEASAVAEGIVLWHINPRVTREVEQSTWRAFPIKPDHLGRLVQLPNGEIARVEDITYQDDFTQLTLSSTFRAVVTDVVAGAGDTLLYSDGRPIQLDSGAYLERS